MISCIGRKDLAALHTHRRIFEKIVVHPLENARVELEFVLRNLSTPLRNGEVGNCLSVPRMDYNNDCAEYVLIPQLSIRSTACITSIQISESVLIQKYLVDRLSMRDIARELACSKTHIRDQLLKHNIPLRQPNRRYNKWHAYGKRRIGGKTIDHKVELRTIATIKQMYAEGNNTSAIARFLNTMKIPTKQQGKGWHQNTVATILKREGVYIVGRRGKEVLSA